MKKNQIFFVHFLPLLTIVSLFSVDARTHTANPDYHNHANKPTIFNILSYGAKGNGVSDDTKALEAAWNASCNVLGATLEIPSDFNFLIGPITLKGPCTRHLTLQIDGTIIAPPKGNSWAKSNLQNWIIFGWLHNFRIQGTGTFDGQGSSWWYDSDKKLTKDPRRPTAVSFYASDNISVRNIRIVNSPQFHLMFYNSTGVKVHNIKISAPENSPNTDGIHLELSQDVVIRRSKIESGDDCVSIQTGCKNIFVHGVECGPGHGISLGGLGKDGAVACVSNIIVRNVVMKKTQYGARIKTWQGGQGSVQNVSFSKIKVHDVSSPIMIDQYYCYKPVCENHTNAVALSGIEFHKITGTYSDRPVHIACSDTVPCTNINLMAVQLRPSAGIREIEEGLCWSSYGTTKQPLLPSSVDCLSKENGNGMLQKIAKSHQERCSF